MDQNFINTTDYSPIELVTFGVGCLCWIIVYFFTLRSIFQRQFVEIPLVTIAGNIVWEFLWSWVFVTDMGSLFMWGYRIWFFMDCLIVYGAFRYGYKQISIPALARITPWLLGFGIVAWSPVLYYYIKIYDEPISHMGAYSGYLLNVMISATYITLALRLDNWTLFSYPASWYKAVGNLLINVFCFLHFSDGFLLSLCVLTTVFDVIFLYLFIKARTSKIIGTPNSILA
ncbi:transmembrane-type terpene cyclase [Fibrella aquatica]|uniref:transmembrane-type terpene cyclase n=1 Tax=Fibrella aquatica TaxID=3242487 RepID=UPI0035213695